MKLIEQPSEPRPLAGTPRTRIGHAATLRRSTVVPAGWPEAWVWACSCGLGSWSILRDRASAYQDHEQEHLVFEVDRGQGRLRVVHAQKDAETPSHLQRLGAQEGSPR